MCKGKGCGIERSEGEQGKCCRVAKDVFPGKPAEEKPATPKIAEPPKRGCGDSCGCKPS